MKGYLSDHPTLRGFLIIAAIAAVVVALSLEPTLAALGLLARIAFFLAIAFFVFLMWRERRGDIALWPRHALVGFYGGALVTIAALAIYFWRGASGLDAVALLVILALGAFSMWRTWRDQHAFGS
jgi:small-conductance mechanosensitive channel